MIQLLSPNEVIEFRSMDDEYRTWIEVITLNVAQSIRGTVVDANVKDSARGQEQSFLNKKDRVLLSNSTCAECAALRK